MDDAADRLVDMTRLRDKFGRESPVIVANQRNVTPEIRVFSPESYQLALLGEGQVSERISFGDQAPNCLCYGECHALSVSVSGHWVNLSIRLVCCVAHKPIDPPVKCLPDPKPLFTRPSAFRGFSIRASLTQRLSNQSFCGVG
jgi:hypothetical protein